MMAMLNSILSVSGEEGIQIVHIQRGRGREAVFYRVAISFSE
jgi:hypothetical protein